MGREIRRVPPNWQHPQKEHYDPFRGVTEMRYQPLYDSTAESAWAEWQAEFAKWLASEHDRVTTEYGAERYPKGEPYRAFCAWHGAPPDPEYYRPAWNDEEATWFQAYETVSEGTPVSPPFATAEELIEYLATNGDFWDQKRRAEEMATGRKCSMNCQPWGREAAERFVRRGHAFSLVVEHTSEGTSVKEPSEQ